MRLTLKDHKVIDAFVEKRKLDGKKLSTDGRSLDGLWMGGHDIAEWKDGLIVMNDLGSKAALTVHRAIRGWAAPVQLAEFHDAVVSGKKYRPRRR